MNSAERVRAQKPGSIKVTKRIVQFAIGRVTLRELEIVTLDAVLKKNEGCKKTTAVSLGISRTALYMKLKRHGLG